MPGLHLLEAANPLNINTILSIKNQFSVFHLYPELLIHNVGLITLPFMCFVATANPLTLPVA